jgi:hypothetical protein
VTDQDPEKGHVEVHMMRGAIVEVACRSLKFSSTDDTSLGWRDDNPMLYTPVTPRRDSTT